MSTVVMALIVVHIIAVVAKFSVFVVIPRLGSVADVRRFLEQFRPWERGADWTLWLTGAGLLASTSWRLLTQTWMLVSIGLYVLVFLAVRFALTRELARIAQSKKLYAEEELRRLRTSNWCVAVLAAVLLGIVAYLMMTRP